METPKETFESITNVDIFQVELKQLVDRLLKLENFFTTEEYSNLSEYEQLQLRHLYEAEHKYNDILFERFIQKRIPYYNKKDFVDPTKRPLKPIEYDKIDKVCKYTNSKEYSSDNTVWTNLTIKDKPSKSSKTSILTDKDSTTRCINASYDFWEKINKEIKEYIGSRINAQYFIDYDNIKQWTIKKPL